jgi:hypothetical protein
MSDDPAYLADLVGVCDRCVSELRAALGDAAAERAAVERAVEHYRATRRAHGIFPDDEFVTHFFLADSLEDASGADVRKPALLEANLDAATTARINDLFLEVLGI